MRILLIHNYYRSAVPSGENVVFDAEAELLESAGHEVHRWTRSNDAISSRPIRTAISSTLFSTSNPWAVKSLSRQIMQFQPQIVHIHNTFPLISPAVLETRAQNDAAYVVTQHNYRSICAQGGLLRDGQDCTKCLEGPSSLPAVVHGCYRGRLASIPVAAMITRHRRAGTWTDKPDATIALSEFHRHRLIRGGFDADRVHVKANFCAPANPVPWQSREPYAVFLGRVTAAKGLDTLVNAWAMLGSSAPDLKIIGDGDDMANIRALVRGHAGACSKIEMLGHRPHSEAMSILSRARLLIFPSTWPEPFGMGIIEAYARGVPVMASRAGGIAELVEEGRTGILFPARDARALAGQVWQHWNDPISLSNISRNALSRWKLEFSPSAGARRLEEIYGLAQKRRNSHSIPGRTG